MSPKDPIVLEPLIEGGLQDQEVVKLADLGGGMLLFDTSIFCIIYFLIQFWD